MQLLDKKTSEHLSNCIARLLRFLFP